MKNRGIGSMKDDWLIRHLEMGTNGASTVLVPDRCPVILLPIEYLYAYDQYVMSRTIKIGKIYHESTTIKMRQTGRPFHEMVIDDMIPRDLPTWLSAEEKRLPSKQTFKPHYKYHR